MIRIITRLLEFAVFGSVVVVLGGLALGYRPIVLTSGSMAPTAPTGSLVVVTKVPPEEISVGDVIVMTQGAATKVTHRVIGLSDRDGKRYAATQGDANSSADPWEYQLEPNQTVASFVVPVIGSLLLPLAGRFSTVAVFCVVLAVGLTLLGRRHDKTKVEENVQVTPSNADLSHTGSQAARTGPTT